jgi:hypothetical protein
VIEIRQELDGRRMAIKTSEKISAGVWFIFHIDVGGPYGDGAAEKVDEWPVAPLAAHVYKLQPLTIAERERVATELWAGATA